MGKIKLCLMERLGKEEKKDKRDTLLKVTAEKKSLLVRQLAACQCVFVCVWVRVCACTYWSLEFAVFWHSCSRLQLLSVSEHPPLEQLYLRDRAKQHLVHICTTLSFSTTTIDLKNKL